MITAYIGVGSNISPEENIYKAFLLLAKKVSVTAASTCFRTPPLLGRKTDDFVNCVWEIRTDCDAASLKASVLFDIENECGRTRTGDKYGPRTIDLDLLLYGDAVMRHRDFELPHPDIRTRPFVALPLQEISPGLVLPDTGEPISAIAARMDARDLYPLPELTEKLRKGIVT